VNASATPTADRELPLRDLFWYFLKLGWLAFGGPVGQIGMMHLQVVEQRRWIDEDEFVRALNLMTFWKWRLTVVVVVLGGGLLGLGRALLVALA
jgi:hypothetical protein